MSVIVQKIFSLCDRHINVSKIVSNLKFSNELDSFSFTLDVVFEMREVNFFFPKSNKVPLTYYHKELRSKNVLINPKCSFEDNLCNTVVLVLKDILCNAEKEKFQFLHDLSQKKKFSHNKKLNEILLKEKKKIEKKMTIKNDFEFNVKSSSKDIFGMEENLVILKGIIKDLEKKSKRNKNLLMEFSDLKKEHNKCLNELKDAQERLKEIPVLKNRIEELIKKNEDSKSRCGGLVAKNNWLEMKYSFLQFRFKDLDTKLFESIRMRSVMHSQYWRLVKEKKIIPKTDLKEYKIIIVDEENVISQEIQSCNWYFRKVEHKFGDGYSQHFSVDYFGQKELPTFSFWIVLDEIYKTSWCVVEKGTIKRRKSCLFDIFVKFNSSIDLKDLHKSQYITLLIKEGDDVDNKTVAKIQVKNYIDEFAAATLSEYSPNERELWKNYNVLLFGRIGCGKSSFINSIHTLLNPGNECVCVANVQGIEDFCTENYYTYPIPYLNLSFVDVWGFKKGNYKESDIELLTKGVFPDGWKMKKQSNDLKKLKISVETMIERRVHTAVFFVSYSSLCNKSEENVKAYKILSKFVMNVFLMISHVDKISVDFKNNPCNWKESKKAEKEIEKIIGDAMKMFGINRDRILLGRNYVHEMKKIYFVDLNNFYNCLEMLKQARKNEQKLKEHVLKEKMEFKQ